MLCKQNGGYITTPDESQKHTPSTFSLFYLNFSNFFGLQIDQITPTAF